MNLTTWAKEAPRTIFVIGLDQASVATLRAVLGKFPGVTLNEASTGDQGWAICKGSKSPPDLLLIGWKMSGLAGPGLLNRLRQHPVYAKAPILVVSEVIKRKDFRLLEEFPCTKLVEMPLNEPRLVYALEEINSERHWNEKHAAEINNLFVLARDNPKDLAASLRQLLDKSPNPSPIGILIANSLVEKGYLSQAEQLYRYLIARDSDNLRVINGFGRVLYKLGLHQEAAAQLRVAARECGLNIARLCLLGELELEQLEGDAAGKYLNNALAIDEDSPKAKAGLELCKTLADHVQRHAGAELPRTFASMCNTIAVSLVRDREYTKGVAQYRAALQLISAPAVRAQVMFNLGLAYVRWNKAAEAVPWFEAATKLGEKHVPKARRYLDKLRAKGVDGTYQAPDEDLDEELGFVDGQIIYKNASTASLPVISNQAPAEAAKEEENWFAEEKF